VIQITNVLAADPARGGEEAGQHDLFAAAGGRQRPLGHQPAPREELVRGNPMAASPGSNVSSTIRTFLYQPAETLTHARMLARQRLSVMAKCDRRRIGADRCDNEPRCHPADFPLIPSCPPL